MVVAGGDDGERLWMQGRLFQLWQCVRDHVLDHVLETCCHL